MAMQKHDSKFYWRKWDQVGKAVWWCLITKRKARDWAHMDEGKSHALFMAIILTNFLLLLQVQ